MSRKTGESLVLFLNVVDPNSSAARNLIAQKNSLISLYTRHIRGHLVSLSQTDAEGKLGSKLAIRRQIAAQRLIELRENLIEASIGLRNRRGKRPRTP